MSRRRPQTRLRVAGLQPGRPARLSAAPRAGAWPPWRARPWSPPRTCTRPRPSICEDQPAFLNQVLCLETGLAPGELLAGCQAIEDAAGRERAVRFGPRTRRCGYTAFRGCVVRRPGADPAAPTHLATRLRPRTPGGDLVVRTRHARRWTSPALAATLARTQQIAVVGRGGRMRQGMEHVRLQAELRRLAAERDAVVLAHNYQRPEVQDAADFVGDSLELARTAAATEARRHPLLRRALHGRDGQDPVAATRPCSCPTRAPAAPWPTW